MIKKLKHIYKHYNDSLISYLPIKLFDGIIGMIALKIYVTLFIPDAYGEYGVYLITVNMVYLVVMGWVSTSGKRFVEEYIGQGKDGKKVFYTTTFITFMGLYVVIAGLSLLVLQVWPGLTYMRGTGFNISLMIMLLGYSFSSMFVVMLLHVGERKLNVWLIVIGSVLKPAMTIFFHIISNGNIISIILAQGIVDLGLGFVALRRLRVFSHIDLSVYDRKLLSRLLKFGYPLIGLNLVLFLLNFSDQYVITLFIDKAANGIYKANYTVPSSVMTMLMVGIIRTVYPRTISHWNQGDRKEAGRTVSLGFKYFTMIGFPAAVGIFMLSEDLAILLLESKYVEGYQVMGLVGFAMVLYGMSDYANKGYEMNGHTANVFLHGFIAATVNLILNFVLVPKYGYVAAAYTTLAGFFTYFTLSYIRRAKELPWHIDGISFLKVLASSLVMALAVKIMQIYLPSNILMTMASVVVGVIVYFVCVILTGLLKEEITRFKHKGQ